MYLTWVEEIVDEKKIAWIACINNSQEYVWYNLFIFQKNNETTKALQMSLH